MKNTLLISLFLLTSWVTALARMEPPTDFQTLLKKLEISLLEGNKRALRDLGSLLDVPEAQEKSRQLIQQYTLFKSDEFSVEGDFSRLDFLGFYYDTEAILTYSELLEAYYITDPAKRKAEYKVSPSKSQSNIDPSVLLNQYISQIDQAIAENNLDDLISGIRKTGKLQRPEAYHFLTELMGSKKLSQSTIENKEKIYEHLIIEVKEFTDIKTLKSVLQIIDSKKFPLAFAQRELANMTNVYLEAKSTKKLVKKYYHLIDSLSTVEEIRTYGYQKLFSTRPSFFIETVDYYGRMLSLSNPYFWIEHNAIKDLAQSQHPRAMFYLAGQLYKIRLRKTDYYKKMSKAIVQKIKSMTKLNISVHKDDGRLTRNGYKSQNPTACKNYLFYWASHYNDYEWDENRFYFINKNEAIETTQNYERLFRRLNSKNDSVAISSFITLTEGEPNEVIALSEKYRQMFRNYNERLPSFQYKYLEQLSQLTDYCRKNGVNYKLSSALTQKLNQLIITENPIERISIENELIDQLTLSDITGLEYWACLQEGKIQANYSISRILDWFYSQSLKEIMTDNRELRLYLKKADIFGNIGAIGTCNYYLNKFSLDDPNFQHKLLQIEETESDDGILTQLSQLIDTNNEDHSNFGLSAFLNDPTNMHKRDIKVLSEPSSADYQSIIKAIKKTDDVKAIKRILYYIRLHPQVEMVPSLFKLINDDRIIVKKRSLELTVADNLAPIMEKIYSYAFPEIEGRKKFDIIPWKALWEQEGDNYKNWSDTFFEKKLLTLQKKEILNIEDINRITASPNYSPKYKHQCLEALQKVQPASSVRKLEIEPKLLVSEDLKYFDNFDFSYKTLDDIPKLFDIDDPEKMMDFLNTKAADFDMVDKGSFYNNLFRLPWFITYLGSGKMTSSNSMQINQVLTTYFNENEYLSEFEEQTTQFNIAQLSYLGKSIDQQLKTSVAMSIDEASRVKIQTSILARISYKDIPVAMKWIPDLAPELLQADRFFLVKDFGLPIFDLDENKKRKTLIEKHESLSEIDFYKHYLKNFGVAFEKENKDLDFQKIYNILKYDAVSPFVSSSGGKRDYYTYGIIKLLELHFNTRLGFHEKLNESQTFYDFTSNKRAAAWIKYLEENKLIDPQQKLAPSFNLTRVN